MPDRSFFSRLVAQTLAACSISKHGWPVPVQAPLHLVQLLCVGIMHIAFACPGLLQFAPHSSLGCSYELQQLPYATCILLAAGCSQSARHHQQRQAWFWFGVQVMKSKHSPLISSVFFMLLPDKVRPFCAVLAKLRA